MNGPRRVASGQISPNVSFVRSVKQFDVGIPSKRSKEDSAWSSPLAPLCDSRMANRSSYVPGTLTHLGLSYPCLVTSKTAQRSRGPGDRSRGDRLQSNHNMIEDTGKEQSKNAGDGSHPCMRDDYEFNVYRARARSDCDLCFFFVRRKEEQSRAKSSHRHCYSW